MNENKMEEINEGCASALQPREEKEEKISNDINWEKYYMLFKELEKSKEKLSKLGIGNKDLDFIIKFLDDYLNNYEVQIDENYITLLESSKKSMIHAVIYNNVPYDFYKFNQQLKNEVCDAWDRLANLHIVQKDHRNMLREILRVDLRRIILPEEIILRDGRRISVNVKELKGKRIKEFFRGEGTQ